MKLPILLTLFATPLSGFSLPPRTSTNTTIPITVTKVTPSYWRATFSFPPFNIQTSAWFTALYTLISDLAADPAVKVVVFDSNVPDFYIAHLDLLNPIDTELVASLWSNLTRLINLPVLSIAAVRGIAHGGGAEFAAAMDVRFASREKAVFGQLEDVDADTAAAYGWINRAVADAEFENFVDGFARRVASFDKAAIAEAKRIVNERAGYPTVGEQAEDWKSALGLLSTSNVQSRVAKLVELGLQKDNDFEVHVADRLMEVQGEGPWNA